MRTRAHLEQRGISYEFIDIDRDDNAERQVIAWNEGKRKMPTVEMFVDEKLVTRVAEPSNTEMDHLLRTAHLDSRADQTTRRSGPSNRDEDAA